MQSTMPVVLWLDNDSAYLLPYLEELRDAGCQVIVAETIGEAKRHILTQPRLDLAILDIMVPIRKNEVTDETFREIEESYGGYRTGILIARFIREHRPDLRFFGFTVRFDEDVARWFREHGAELLTKYRYSDPTEFVSVVRQRLYPSLRAVEHLPSPARPAPNASATQISDSQVRLKEIELQYQLAHAGLSKGQLITMVLILKEAKIFVAIILRTIVIGRE